MPVTLVLTDDQALEIVAQIGKLLARKCTQAEEQLKLPEVASRIQFRKGKRTLASKVDEFVLSKKSGSTFSVGTLYDKFSLEGKRRGPVSAHLSKLKRKGTVKMLQRGTWQVA